MKPVSFAVVATSHTDKEWVKWFIAYQLNCGAQKVYVYLDDPAPDQMLAVNDPRVQIENRFLDDYHTLGLSPSASHDISNRHSFNAMCAIRQARDEGIDWLIRIDIDELIQLPNHRFDDLLLGVPNDVQQIIVRTKEALPSKLENDMPFLDITHFRHQSPVWSRGRAGIEHRVIKALGCGSALFAGQYFRGHKHGKFAVRTDSPIVSMSAHRAYSENSTPLHTHVHPNCSLLHYDAPSFRVWVEKWRRRISGFAEVDRMSTHRRKQLECFIHAYGSHEELQLLFKNMYMMRPTVYWRLSFVGLAGKAVIPRHFFDMPPLLSGQKSNSHSCL